LRRADDRAAGPKAGAAELAVAIQCRAVLQEDVAVEREEGVVAAAQVFLPLQAQQAALALTHALVVGADRLLQAGVGAAEQRDRRLGVCCAAKGQQRDAGDKGLRHLKVLLVV
jgi:hypothetical protein